MTGLYVVALEVRYMNLLFLEIMSATSEADAVDKVADLVLQRLGEQGIDTTFWHITNSKVLLLGHY